MSIPRSVADPSPREPRSRRHRSHELNVYQSKLQSEKLAAWFFRFHRRQAVPSSALMSEMTRAFLAQVDAFYLEDHYFLSHVRTGRMPELW